MDDLDTIADALRFLANKAGGIEQLPFDPFAAIERLRGRTLPELPEGWQIRAMDGDIWLSRERKHPQRCWEVFGEGPTFAAAISDALTKIGPDGFPFDDPGDDGDWKPSGFLRLPAGTLE
jgi:hypothetical protein